MEPSIVLLNLKDQKWIRVSFVFLNVDPQISSLQQLMQCVRIFYSQRIVVFNSGAKVV